jgi:excisionase family DNA binding protein
VSLDRLIDEITETIVSRVVAELDGRVAAGQGEEPWRLLNVEEAAERLGRSTRWVRERVKGGQLPYVRLDGSAFAFEFKDLEAFAKARRVDAMDVERAREAAL